MTDTPKCSSCALVRGTPYGGLGPKRCQADPQKREVGGYYHVSPSDGLPLDPFVKEPRPGWCPRLAEGTV